MSPTEISGFLGSQLNLIGDSFIASTILFPESRFFSIASQVAARYKAPVSKYFQLARIAIALAVLDFPDPLGPSIARTSDFMYEFYWFRELTMNFVRQPTFILQMGL